MMKRIQFAVFVPISWASLLVATLLMPTGTCALGQALPAAEAAPVSTGFALPTALGSLQYAVSASQSLVWGYYDVSGVASSTNLTGDLAYLSGSKSHPFSLVLSGGQSWSESGQPSYRFVNLGFSQVANVGRWNFVLSDNVSYLPGTAAAGLSGIPGVGDLGVNPVQVGVDSGQGVLTNYSNRVNNIAVGSLSRQLTGKTALNASGSYGITRFLDNSTGSSNSSISGLDSDSATGGAGISHVMDARNSISGNYAYSKYTYPNNVFGIVAPGFVSQTGSASYTHQFTRKFSMYASAGPQWTRLDTSGSQTSLSLFANASADYAGKYSLFSVAYSRSTNSGYGSVGGALYDSVVARVNRKFAVVWNCSASASYSRSSSLPVANVASYSFNTYVEGVQVSRAIARSLSGYASYTLEDQSGSAASAIDVFSGLSQVLGFGITFSPSAMHFGRQ